MKLTPTHLRRVAFLGVLAVGPPALADGPLADPRTMAASREDLWGEAAVRAPGGPSYEFFEGLLPPLRYVNAAFRHYPIVLSAPRAPVKSRWVSDGRGINLRADRPPMWKEAGTPVAFLIADRDGKTPRPFGAEAGRLDGPRYLEGGLPVVRIDDRNDSGTVSQEAFAAVDAIAARHGAVLVRFRAERGAVTVSARVESTDVKAGENGAIVDGSGGRLLLHRGWNWDSEARTLSRSLAAGETADLCVLTRPAADVPSVWRDHDAARAEAVRAWSGLLGQGAVVEGPEARVNDASRALVLSQFAIAVGDRMHYSAGNAYDHLYEAECGDALRSLLLFGHADAAREMLGPLLDFDRKATRFHVAGHKLQLLAFYYGVTHDAATLRAKGEVWNRVIEFVRDSRRGTKNGLMPSDNYAGDIATQVVALNSNANCWRGLRDVAAVVADLGDPDRAALLRKEAGEFREALLKAVAASERRDVDPPFIPNALFGAEGPHDPLTATRTGSYYDLMAPYILGSGVFGAGSERERWMIDYLRRHGGLALGMIRSTPRQGQFNGEDGVNVLYGLRYNLTLLRNDDRLHALAGFYGHLAQGMTRDTYVGGEGSRFFHGDAQGRSFYLPPNSAANATFLLTLRYLLVQDWDADDDGRADTLRLHFGAPGGWLADGARVRVEKAPSAFGPVSYTADSDLARGEVRFQVQEPPRRPDRWLVRPSLPPGWSVTSASVGSESLTLLDDGTADLSGRGGRFTTVFRVRKSDAK